MATVFKLFIDTDDDDVVDEEFTQYVRSMEWSLGFSDENQFVAPLSWAKIVLDDLSSLVPGDTFNHQVKIQGVSDTITRTLWSGWGRSIEDVGGDRQEMVLHCVGFEEPLYTQRVSIPIQLDQQAGSILQLVIDQVNFRIKDQSTMLILNDAVLGFLGKTLESKHPITTDLDTGIQTFPYAGDRWDNALAIDIIKDIVSSDGGRFFADREGVLTFRDRNLLIKGTGTIIDDAAVVDFNFVTGSQLFNASQVTFAGRFVGAADSTLFQIDSALKIRGGIARKIKCRFRDSNDNPAGATVVNGLAPGVNYEANSAEDGSGTDQTANINIVQIAADGNSVTLEFHHAQAFDIWLTVFNITGTPVSKSDPMTVEIVNVVDATKDGYRYISSAAPLLSSSILAEDFARFELFRRVLTESMFVELVAVDLISVGLLDDVEAFLSDNMLVDGNMEASGTSAYTALSGGVLTKETTDPFQGLQVLRVAGNGGIAAQTILTQFEFYRIRGRARSDGTGIPQILVSGFSAWVGTNSTSWQVIDVVIYCETTNLKIEFRTGIGAYVEWDDIKVVLGSRIKIFGTKYKDTPRESNSVVLVCGYTWNIYNVLPFYLDGATVERSLLS